MDTTTKTAAKPDYRRHRYVVEWAWTASDDAGTFGTHGMMTERQANLLEEQLTARANDVADIMDVRVYRFGFVKQSHRELRNEIQEALGADDTCDRCFADLCNGEGFNGLCGTCADRAA